MCFLRSPLCMYTWVINVCPGWKTAGNRGNHQNFDPTLLTKKLWPFNMRMKQKKNFSEKINLKWPPKKKLIFQNRQFLKFFRENFLDWSLGWNDWSEGHWFGSNYMAVRQSNMSSKTGKKCIFSGFLPSLSLCWTASRLYRLSQINALHINQSN